MYISFKNKKIKKVCENFKIANRTHGSEVAKILVKRLDQIKAFKKLGDFVNSKLGNCHQLKGTREGQFAAYLDQKKRLIFKPILEKTTPGKEINYFEATEILILEVKDYHGW